MADVSLRWLRQGATEVSGDGETPQRAGGERMSSMWPTDRVGESRRLIETRVLTPWTSMRRPAELPPGAWPPCDGLAGIARREGAGGILDSARTWRRRSRLISYGIVRVSAQVDRVEVDGRVIEVPWQGDVSSPGSGALPKTCRSWPRAASWSVRWSCSPPPHAPGPGLVISTTESAQDREGHERASTEVTLGTDHLGRCGDSRCPHHRSPRRAPAAPYPMTGSRPSLVLPARS